MGNKIEVLIDRAGLANVLRVIGEICHGKAEHLRGNWQDGVTARVWEKMAGVISKEEEMRL